MTTGRTFSDEDIIRFYENNLTRREQRRVVRYFRRLLGVPEPGTFEALERQAFENFLQSMADPRGALADQLEVAATRLFSRIFQRRVDVRCGFETGGGIEHGEFETGGEIEGGEFRTGGGF